MVRLALLRHGHTDWNRAGRIQGRTDIPLDAAARTQLTGLRLPDPWLHADLVSSPLSRARDTAECVGGRAPGCVEALTEMNWGLWEGQTGAALLADPDCAYRDISEWGMTFRPPMGESVADVTDRVLGWALGLERDTVAVCHIGVMRVLLAAATGWRFDGPPPFRIKRNRIYVLTRHNRVWQLAPQPIPLVEVTSCAS